jgi:hypothetical protein
MRDHAANVPFVYFNAETQGRRDDRSAGAAAGLTGATGATGATKCDEVRGPDTLFFFEFSVLAFVSFVDSVVPVFLLTSLTPVKVP